nr:DUF6789 family protein [Halocatena pleomorpha]
MAVDENERTTTSEGGTTTMADTEKTSVSEVGTTTEELAAIIRDGVVGAAGGLVGTALMTVVLLVGNALGGFDLSSFAALAELTRLNTIAPAIPAGYFIFLGGGMTTWPLLFASVEQYLPGKTIRQRGVPFGTVLWTGFVIAFYTGQTGAALYVYLITTLVAHWVYGFGLGSVFDYLSNRPDTLV